MTGWLRWRSAIAGLGLGFAACSHGPVPHETLAAAEDAVDRAQAAHAWDLAPNELARAQQKLAAARAAMRQRANQPARRFAEQALVDAELATARARTTAAHAFAAQLREHLDGGWRQFAAVAGDG